MDGTAHGSPSLVSVAPASRQYQRWIDLPGLLIAFNGRREIRVDIALVHKDRGIALVDIAPNHTANAVDLLRGGLVRAGLPGAERLPIIALRLEPAQVPDLPQLLDEALPAGAPTPLPADWMTPLPPRWITELPAALVTIGEAAMVDTRARRRRIRSCLLAATSCAIAMCVLAFLPTTAWRAPSGEGVASRAPPEIPTAPAAALSASDTADDEVARPDPPPGEQSTASLPAPGSAPTMPPILSAPAGHLPLPVHPPPRVSDNGSSEPVPPAAPEVVRVAPPAAINPDEPGAATPRSATDDVLPPAAIAAETPIELGALAAAPDDPPLPPASAAMSRPATGTAAATPRPEPPSAPRLTDGAVTATDTPAVADALPVPPIPPTSLAALMVAPPNRDSALPAITEDAAPHSPLHATVATASPSPAWQPISARCAPLLARLQLGEMPTNAETSLLRTACAPRR